MKNNKKIVAVIPARLGSVRVKFKNLRLIGGKPLISYIIQSTKQSNSFDEIYLNSESELFGEIAKNYGVQFYKRPPELATSSSMIDEYIYDFLKHVECDVIAVVNPTSPFLKPEEMDKAIDQFLDSDCDTQLCCEKIQTHCFIDGKAVNFNTDGQHPRSQDLSPVLALNFAITIWDSKKFIKHFEAEKHAVYTGKLGFFITEGLSSIDIDYEEDFQIANLVMENLNLIRQGAPAQYHSVVNNEKVEGKK